MGIDVEDRRAPDEVVPLLSAANALIDRAKDHPGACEDDAVRVEFGEAFCALNRARAVLEKQIIAQKIKSEEAAIERSRSNIERWKQEADEW